MVAKARPVVIAATGSHSNGCIAGWLAALAYHHIATGLRTGARTWLRRLTDADLTFRQLVEDTRRELAHHYPR